MRLLTFALFMMLISVACRRNSTPVVTSGPSIDIFLLDSFQYNVDETTVPATVLVADANIGDRPYISNDEIIGYERETNTFLVRSRAAERLTQLNPGGFVVTVERVPVYFGFIRPPYLSSIIFGSPTISAMQPDPNRIAIDFATVDDAPHLRTLDKRNEPTLLAALAKSGRLR